MSDDALRTSVQLALDEWDRGESNGLMFVDRIRGALQGGTREGGRRDAPKADKTFTREQLLRHGKGLILAVREGMATSKSLAVSFVRESVSIAIERDELAKKVEALSAEILKALKIGYQRTADCQTVPEMATELVAIIDRLSKENDKQLARACAAEKERDRLNAYFQEQRDQALLNQR